MTLTIAQHLLDETTHSPSLVDLVGYENAQQIVDFCFIANPYYPTDGMIKKITALFPHLIRSYPSSNPGISAGFLATVLKVDKSKLIIGNGATELITEICASLIRTVGVPIPTFGEYIEKIDPAKLRLYPLKAETDYQLDLDLYLDWLCELDLKAAVVINPHNPTGQLFSLDQMHSFLRKASHLDLVIVDESFIDFAAEQVPSLLATSDQFDNLIIVRSMSKHCGVPGLRLGYCYSGNQALVDRMRTALPTWNVNTLAEYYLSLLPDTDSEYHESRLHVLEDVRHLYAELQELQGFRPYPTGANFILIRVENGMTARELQLKLLQEYQLYVRDCSNKQGLDKYHIRVASQGRTKDQLLIDALTAISKGQSKATVTLIRQRASPRILIPTCHHIRKHRIVQYLDSAHLDMLLRFDGIPIIVPALETSRSHLMDYVQEADGLLLVEGEDVHPDYYRPPESERHYITSVNDLRDTLELELLRYALQVKLSILGICRGSQLLNIVYGGTLYPDVVASREGGEPHIDYDNYHGFRHPVNFVPGTWLHELYNQDGLPVTSYHHQGVNRLGDGLRPLAYAGDGLLEAFDDPNERFVVGLQFHPERMADEHPANVAIFERFVSSAATRDNV